MPFTFFIELLFVCAFIAIVWFAISRLGVPEPIKTVVLAIIALIVLWWLWSVFGMGTLGGHWRCP